MYVKILLKIYVFKFCKNGIKMLEQSFARSSWLRNLRFRMVFLVICMVAISGG